MKEHDVFPFFVAFVVMCFFTAVMIFVILENNKTRAYWDEAQIIKICRDGTHIYKMKDGTYRTPQSSFRVLNPNVCE